MDTGFHHEQAFGSALNRHAISFQSSAMDSTSEMIMMGNYYGGINTTAGMIFPGSSSIVNNSGISQVGSSCGSPLVDSVPGLKHDAGLAAEWSVEEQYKLEEGLVKYADEPSILRYIKIAATLHDKTVRDVALRCRWMTRKRRKQEDLSLGKKVKEKKDKLVESSSKPCISSASPSNLAAYSLSVNHHAQSDGMPSEALSGRTRHLLEQNNQVLGRISANISSLKLQDNIDLFCHMRNNLTAILNEMRYLPGPPLPESINEELANSILSNTSQRMVFGSPPPPPPPSGIHMKQEPPGY